MIKAILTLITYATSLAIILFFGFLAGHYMTLDACNTFLKTEASSPLPDYEPTKYYRYGGGDGFENQMDRIRRQGKEELLKEWDEFQVELYPWDVVKNWR